ncbi:hypothetical protein SERLA73DRAFT_183555 [Serpula lacrymans var. lacrymans S7.3]|uniref:Aprataxin and PNK-like factor PBZ domain-containing protein n=2 Tax=Serpula lacrymans var. lacrymans TaxID=341189 RepID=F8Q034_SERL3|nr:uncharacterized protein SERLADRAFT_416292 [Serpula lacrymans var. lacrymans S7.9]EGN98506.1 hypothetical protein SERLA73DRAFT_183555 [Serpula lacrymans var. lacrymans S7.3]EGO24080.1 hypothetical protein SERLADRAFT_416292 [Serpula lacrymans var. lacrymans S7.9]
MDPFPFNADVADRILTYLPNFSSLLSAILSSRFVYSVYKARPNSISRAILYNQLGAALPPALRLVRCGTDNFRQSPVSELCREDELANKPEITCDEAVKMSHHLKVVNELEDLFSWRQKDRTSSTSRLSDMESLRFRRAMYRIWLFSSIYGRPSVPEGGFLFDEEDEAGANMLESIIKQRGFMSSFSASELQELERVMCFLSEIAKWSGDANTCFIIATRTWVGHALSCGPQTILQAYNGKLDELNVLEELDPDGTDSWVNGFLSDVITHSLLQHDIRATYDHSDKIILLDSVTGKEDQCKQCNETKGLRLWNASNWSYLRGRILPSSLSGHLKGLLIRNVSELGPFSDAVKLISFATLFDEIWDQKTPSYGHWDKQDWLCDDCVMVFIREHLHLWWLDCKRKLGHPIHPDCWYGYNCRTQTHSIHHASRLNHLCEPTRGSGL